MSALDRTIPASGGGASLTTRHVQVELFGVPRVLVGRRSVDVLASGATLADAARALVRTCPELRERVLDPASGWPNAGYAFAVGRQFTRDRDCHISDDAVLLLVSSTPGG